MSWPARVQGAFLGFFRDARAASAVEFALVAAPFLVLLLGILQISIYYLTQASLDAGVNNTAGYLRSQFTSASPTFPTAAALKAKVVSTSGGVIYNNSTLAVEIRQLTTLAAGAVAITDAARDYGSTTSTLVLRAQSSVVTFAPGFSSLAYVRSSAIVRRQGT